MSVRVEWIGGKPRGMSEEVVEKLVAETLKQTKRRNDGVVAMRAVDDNEMTELNRRYRGKNATTDVLSFAYGEEVDFIGMTDSTHLGDIVLCIPQIRRQAKEIGRPISQEISLMIVHGTLHLLGFDHVTRVEEQEMFALQHDILIKTGIF